MCACVRLQGPVTSGLVSADPFIVLGRPFVKAFIAFTFNVIVCERVFSLYVVS